MTVHKTVLLKEAVENLNLRKGAVVVDATLGGGGHSREILKLIESKGKLIAIDRDAEAIKRFKKEIEVVPKNLIFVNDNFSEIGNILDNLKIGKVEAVLADFGLSSDQLDDVERGFSFLSDAELDMRMDQTQALSAREIVNDYSVGELIRIFRVYGEEKSASQIARKIVEGRKNKKIKTTFELVKIIGSAIPERHKHQKIHFATRVFQALRIEVNAELRSIEKFIQGAVKYLDKKGRLAVISFHSGEDRIAKTMFRKMGIGCKCPPEFPVCQCNQKAQVKIITKKPIMASEKEIKENPRSRSAKLRVVEKK